MSGRLQAAVPQHIMAKHAGSFTLKQSSQAPLQDQQHKTVPSQQHPYPPSQQVIPVPSQQQHLLSSHQQTYVPSQQERRVPSQQQTCLSSRQQVPVSSQQGYTVPAQLAAQPGSAVMYVKPPWAIDDPFQVFRPCLICLRRQAVKAVLLQHDMSQLQLLCYWQSSSVQ